MNSVSIPTMEPDRQYYFMNQCKTLVLEKKAALNRPLTYNIQTFGCQMNSHDSEKLKGIMDEIGYEDYVYGEGVCLIEWANLIEEILPDHYQKITIRKDLEKGFDYREIEMEEQ